MNDKTKDGLKLGGMISLLVGVISLIVVIPTIARIMNPPPIKEYYQIIISDDFSTQKSFRFTNLSESTPLSLTHDTETAWSISQNGFSVSNANYRFEFINYYTIITTLPKISITSSGAYSAYYTMSAFGIYDFSAIVVETNGQILTPIFTPF